MKLKTVLVIDDEPMICQLVKTSLENLWPTLRVEVCTDGQQAVHMAESLKPSLILLDINMPVLSGTDIAMKLKERTQTHAIPIVFLTGMLTHDEAQSKGNQIGGAYFLAKPVSIQEIVQTVEKFIQ